MQMVKSDVIEWFVSSTVHPSGIVINLVFLILSKKYNPFLHVICVVFGAAPGVNNVLGIINLVNFLP